VTSELLSTIDLDVTYRSDSSRLVSSFYVPCLRRSVLYRRAVGYFTSSGLAVAAQGIAHLINNGGKIRLVASPALSEEDAEAIASGYEDRHSVVSRVTAKELSGIEDHLTRARLGALAWLISQDCLDIRLAIRMDSSGKPQRGIYHEKIGVFTDNGGNHVAFVGSPNETAGGLVANFESIDVYWSWEDPQDRVDRKIDAFDRLWNNETDGLDVLHFPDTPREILESYRTKTPPTADPDEVEEASDEAKSPENSDGHNNTPVIPREITLRPHQIQAQQSWFTNNGLGTLKMATGAGKTFSALAIAAETYRKASLKALVVICPFQHLVVQWAKEARRFGLDPVLAFKDQAQWVDLLNSQLFALRSGTIPFVSVITTNRTFCLDTFQFSLGHFPKSTLIVGDEAHNLGAKGLRAKLPENVRYRLALSATPERWFDDSGTASIFEYFGPVLQPEFTLEDALRGNVLSPYDYYPILIDLSPEETDEYLQISAQIAKYASGIESGDDNPALTSLLVRRARLLGSAEGKIPALKRLMKKRLETTHTLFYCGDGSVESEVTEESRRQVEEVTRVLGQELRYRVASYTFETRLEERDSIRIRFENGELQGLVAIRCLDEGVDIPLIQRAVILASSRNPRQFIQRRGRILRKSPGKPKAEIYDMIVIPAIDGEISDSERNLMKKEIVRFKEFAGLALNAGQAISEILPIQSRFGLLDV